LSDQKLPGDRSDLSFIKLFTMKLLEKTGGNEKIKLLLQNLVNNYNYDNSVIDVDGRILMEKFSVKWKTHVQKLTHKAFDKVSQELKTATAKKKERKFGEISIYTHEALLTYLSKIKAYNQERLTMIHFLYFQVPNLKLIKNLFFELNSSQFTHLGSTMDENFRIERKRECKNLLSEESAPFYYLNYMKFGVPPSHAVQILPWLYKYFPID
jgi:hypothetical protein